MHLDLSLITQPVARIPSLFRHHSLKKTRVLTRSATLEIFIVRKMVSSHPLLALGLSLVDRVPLTSGRKALVTPKITKKITKVQ